MKYLNNKKYFFLNYIRRPWKGEANDSSCPPLRAPMVTSNVNEN